MYITTYKSNNRTTLNNLNYNTIMQTTINESNDYYKTTIKIDNPTPFDRLTNKQQVQIYAAASHITTAYYILSPYADNHEEQYYEFKIPKRSGGLRTINAPLTNFKDALTEVKDIFEKKIKCLSHNCAYAYTKNRSTLDALIQHQKNKSNWYLKLDLQDFFPNCTPTLIYNQLTQLYPFYYFNQLPGNLGTTIPNQLQKIINICCLRGGLPQGTPMSPLLTNLIMIPFDYTIHNYLKRGTGEHYVYTRYADDLLISSKSEFNWQELQIKLAELLQPFTIKQSKTRYGSKAGSNWNLGLMLNKDNNITLGYQKKKTINAMLNNFLKDFANNNYWSKEDTYVLQGQISQLQYIESEYCTYIINKYEVKYNTNYKNAIKTILNN